MKTGIFATLALAAIIGLACGQFGVFPGAAPTTGSSSSLVMFFVLFFFLFFFLNNQTRNVPLNINNVSTGVTIPVSG